MTSASNAAARISGIADASAVVSTGRLARRAVRATAAIAATMTSVGCFVPTASSSSSRARSSASPASVVIDASLTLVAAPPSASKAR